MPIKMIQQSLISGFFATLLPLQVELNQFVMVEQSWITIFVNRTDFCYFQWNRNNTFLKGKIENRRKRHKYCILNWFKKTTRDIVKSRWWIFKTVYDPLNLSFHRENRKSSRTGEFINFKGSFILGGIFKAKLFPLWERINTYLTLSIKFEHYFF